MGIYYCYYYYYLSKFYFHVQAGRGCFCMRRKGTEWCVGYLSVGNQDVLTPPDINVKLSINGQETSTALLLLLLLFCFCLFVVFFCIFITVFVSNETDYKGNMLSHGYLYQQANYQIKYARYVYFFILSRGVVSGPGEI